MSFEDIIENIRERLDFLMNLINYPVIKFENFIFWLLKLRLVIWIREGIFKRLIKH